MAGAKKTTPKAAAVATILDVWGKTDDAKKSENLDRKFKMLMAEGNKDLITKQIAIDDAKSALETAQNEALKTANFNSIATANLKLRAAKLEYADALEVFTTTFGEAPNV